MIIVEAVVLALALSLATGGSLRNLQTHTITGEWALLVLLPIQLAWPRVSETLQVDCDWSRVVWLLMMTVLSVVLLSNAIRHWALVVAALGIALNILVIGLNGGMPVSLSAAQAVGWESAAVKSELDEGCLHTMLREDTALPALADIVPILGPRWHSGVVSVGDLLLAAGLATWVHAASREVEAES